MGSDPFDLGVDLRGLELFGESLGGGLGREGCGGASRQDPREERIWVSGNAEIEAGLPDLTADDPPHAHFFPLWPDLPLCPASRPRTGGFGCPPAPRLTPRFKMPSVRAALDAIGCAILVLLADHAGSAVHCAAIVPAIAAGEAPSGTEVVDHASPDRDDASDVDERSAAEVEVIVLEQHGTSPSWDVVVVVGVARATVVIIVLLIVVEARGVVDQPRPSPAGPDPGGADGSIHDLGSWVPDSIGRGLSGGGDRSDETDCESGGCTAAG